MAWTWLEWTLDKIRAYSRRFRTLFTSTQDQLIVASDNSAGHKIAIVGPPASGKTFIWTFLRSGGTELVAEHRPTLGAKPVAGGATTISTVDESSEINIKLELMLADSIDVSGDLASYPEIWDEVIGDAFLVVFIFDVSRFVGVSDPIRAAGYRNRVIEASKFAGQRIKHADCIVVLALGWCDMLADWSPTNNAPIAECLIEKFPDLVGRVRNNLTVHTDAPARQVDGSLATEDWAANFIYRIFKEGTRGKLVS